MTKFFFACHISCNSSAVRSVRKIAMVKISFSSSIWIISIFYWMLADTTFSLSLFLAREIVWVLTRNKTFLPLHIMESILCVKCILLLLAHILHSALCFYAPVSRQSESEQSLWIEATKSSASEVHNAVFDVKWILELNITLKKFRHTCTYVPRAHCGPRAPQYYILLRKKRKRPFVFFFRYSFAPCFVLSCFFWVCAGLILHTMSKRENECWLSKEVKQKQKNTSHNV